MAKVCLCISKTYIERNESLEGARLDHEALIGDILDDPIEDLPLDRSEDESLELDLVDDLTCGVLNAPIRNVLWLHATQQIFSESTCELL